jgi:hypothetical protein
MASSATDATPIAVVFVTIWVRDRMLSHMPVVESIGSMDSGIQFEPNKTKSLDPSRSSCAVAEKETCEEKHMLHRRVRRGRIHMDWSKYEFDAQGFTKNGYHRLHVAAMHNDVKAVQAELGCGVDVNIKVRTTWGQMTRYNVVRLAALRGFTAVVDVLLDHKASIVEAFDEALASAETQLLDRLLERKADINGQTDTSQTPPLVLNAFYPRVDAVKWLLERHADVSINFKDTRGVTRSFREVFPRCQPKIVDIIRSFEKPRSAPESPLAPFPTSQSVADNMNAKKNPTGSDNPSAAITDSV